MRVGVPTREQMRTESEQSRAFRLPALAPFSPPKEHFCDPLAYSRKGPPVSLSMHLRRLLRNCGKRLSAP
eukprot:407358-Rhodomonas_salina.3